MFLSYEESMEQPSQQHNKAMPDILLSVIITYNLSYDHFLIIQSVLASSVRENSSQGDFI